MARNYQANIVGRPYVRVDKVVIKYDKPDEAHVTFYEAEAILTDSGKVLKIRDLGEVNMVVNPWDMDVDLPVPNPATGVNIPNMLTSYQNCMLNILAVIRKNQLDRDNAVVDLGTTP